VRGQSGEVDAHVEVATPVSSNPKGHGSNMVYQRLRQRWCSSEEGGLTAWPPVGDHNGRWNAIARLA